MSLPRFARPGRGAFLKKNDKKSNLNKFYNSISLFFSIFIYCTGEVFSNDEIMGEPACQAQKKLNPSVFQDINLKISEFYKLDSELNQSFVRGCFIANATTRSRSLSECDICKNYFSEIDKRISEVNASNTSSIEERTELLRLSQRTTVFPDGKGGYRYCLRSKRYWPCGTNFTSQEFEDYIWGLKSRMFENLKFGLGIRIRMSGIATGLVGGDQSPQAKLRHQFIEDGQENFRELVTAIRGIPGVDSQLEDLTKKLNQAIKTESDLNQVELLMQALMTGGILFLPALKPLSFLVGVGAAAAPTGAQVVGALAFLTTIAYGSSSAVIQGGGIENAAGGVALSVVPATLAAVMSAFTAAAPTFLANLANPALRVTSIIVLFKVNAIGTALGVKVSADIISQFDHAKMRLQDFESNHPDWERSLAQRQEHENLVVDLKQAYFNYGNVLIAFGTSFFRRIYCGLEVHRPSQDWQSPVSVRSGD